MSTRIKIQKFFRVFQILTKIAFIFSIIGASCCAVGILCCVAWENGGHVYSLFGESVELANHAADLPKAVAVMLTDLIFLVSEAVLLGFASQYLKIEQEEGTPFTEKGANLVKKLGIRCIYLPIIASVLAAVATVCLNVEQGGDINNLPSVGTGILLILTSLVFRYGAELEQRDRAWEDGGDFE